MAPEVLLIVPVVHDGLMEGENGFNLFGVLDSAAQVAPAVVGVAHGDIHHNVVHLLRSGDPFHHAEQVQETGQTQHQHHGGHGRSALPGFEHPEGFFQQHLGGKVAQHRPEQDTGDEDRQLGPAEESGGEQPQSQSGAEGYAVLENRPYKGHGHHISGGLHMAAAVDIQRDQDQDHPDGRVDSDGFRRTELLRKPIAGREPVHRFLQGGYGGEVLHHGQHAL